MTRILLCLLVPLIITACRSPASAEHERQQVPGPSLLGSRPSGVARVYDAHCGGAALRPEDQARLQRPASNLEFVVLPGKRNTAAPPVARFTTNAQGEFDAPELAPGTYCIVIAARQLSAEQEKELLALPPAPPRPAVRDGDTYIDQDCLKRLPLNCDAVWDVTQPGFDARIDLTGSRCPWNQPCTTYNGPLPP